jgi:hypothetical protein
MKIPSLIGNSVTHSEVRSGQMARHMYHVDRSDLPPPRHMVMVDHLKCGESYIY